MTSEVVVVETVSPTVIVSDSDSDSIIISHVGIQGPAGYSATQSSAIAAVPISSYIGIVIVGELAYPADVTNLAHADLPMAISTTSASAGAAVSYAFSGEIPVTGFTQGQRYFIGPLGVLGSVFRSLGAVWAKFVGVAKSTTTLTVQMDDTYLI